MLKEPKLDIDRPSNRSLLDELAEAQRRLDAALIVLKDAEAIHAKAEQDYWSVYESVTRLRRAIYEINAQSFPASIGVDDESFVVMVESALKSLAEGVRDERSE